MRDYRTRLLQIVWILIVLVLVTSTISASYALTGSIYAIAQIKLPALFEQIINSLLGLFLAGLLIGQIAMVARAKGWVPEMNMFAPIIEAMQKIAKGDFSVQLDANLPTNERLGVLIKGMNDMAIELKQMETMRQEFISNVSHEIQSPLTSIQGFARALQNEALRPDDRLHYLNIIQTESKRLSKLSDNLLALAALDAKNRPFTPQPYRLDKQIRNLILACEPQWATKSIDMEVSLAEVTITADEDLLSQVWINLLSNGIKFTPEGGQISIDVHRQDDTIVFSISDTGIGISEADQARIFERFYKADKARSHWNNGGSGLGLAIAHKIIELHHGTISVASTLAKGTTFRICLPVYPEFT